MKNSNFLQAVVSVINKALNSFPVVNMRIKLEKKRWIKNLSCHSLPAWEWSGSLFYFARRSPTSGCSGGFQRVLLFHCQRVDSKNWKETQRNFIKIIPEIFVHLEAFRVPTFCPTSSWQRFFGGSLGLGRLRRGSFPALRSRSHIGHSSSVPPRVWGFLLLWWICLHQS